MLVRRIRTFAVFTGSFIAMLATMLALGLPAGTVGAAGNSAHALGTRQQVHNASGANMTYHGGKVMQKQSKTYAIFWEPPTLQNGNPTSVSATYNSLLTRYFHDIGGSGLYNNNTQYYQIVSGVQQHIVNNSAFGASWVDTSTYPASGCSDSATPGNCLTDTQIRAEVQKAMTANGWTGGLGKMFFVFTSKNEGSCFDSGSTSCAFTQYCAYHSFFSSAGKPVVYANMPYTGTNLSACGVSTSPNNDFDADSTINVTSHEHMEAVTDPRLNAWYDGSGAEIGDKCAWTFGSVTLDGNKANVQWNTHFYIVQQEWDNTGSHCVLTGP